MILCTALYIISQGSVKLFKLSPKGRELIIRVLEEGATFNEVPIFDYGANPVNVAALEDSYIWAIDAEVIRLCISQHPEMAQAVILNLSHNLRMLVGAVEELSFYQVTNRLARLISRLPAEQLEEQRITQDQLAARLGTVREVVARSLRDLERSGAIRVERRQIQVLNEQPAARLGAGANRLNIKTGRHKPPGFFIAWLYWLLPCRMSGVPAAWTAFNCAWRARSVDLARMRSASSGLWKPMLFSAAMKSHIICDLAVQAARLRQQGLVHVGGLSGGFDGVDRGDQGVLGGVHGVAHLVLDDLHPLDDISDIGVALPAGRLRH